MQDVDFTGPGDLILTVSYPPIDEWPVQSGGTAEIHVDLAIEVYDTENQKVGTFGPGLDWDVFCLTPPPPPPPPGDEGCTPGYWKNHLEDWSATGFGPANDFDTVFGVDLFSPDITLEQAVNARGGGVRKLARHGAAALLSAAHPDVAYPLSVAQVIAAVQAGDSDTLAAFNELGCEIP